MERQISWKRNLAFIWLAEICSRAGFTVAIPFIPLFMRDRYGIESDVQLGFWVSAFSFVGSLALFFSMPLWGMLGDRKGRRLMLLRATFCSGLLLSTFMLAPTVWALVILRFISGFFSGTVSPAQALVVTTTPEERHGFALGALSSSVWSGNMIGFMLGGFVVKYWGYNMAFITGGGLFVAAGFITLFFVRENFVPPIRTVPVKTPHRNFRFQLPKFGAPVYAIFALFIWMAFARRFDEPYLAMLVEKVCDCTGKNAAGITGVISAVAAAGGVLAGIIIGFLSDRSSPRRIIFPVALVGSAAMFMQAFAPNAWALGGARLLTFFVVGGLEPVILSMLSRETPKEKRGMIFGVVASLRITGLLIGSSLGGVVIYLSGIRSVFMVGAVAILFLIPMLIVVERIISRAHHRV